MKFEEKPKGVLDSQQLMNYVENDIACANLYKHIMLDLLNNNQMEILDLADLELLARKIRSNKQTRGIALFCTLVGWVAYSFHGNKSFGPKYTSLKIMQRYSHENIKYL